MDDDEYRQMRKAEDDEYEYHGDAADSEKEFVIDVEDSYPDHIDHTEDEEKKPCIVYEKRGKGGVVRYQPPAIFVGFRFSLHCLRNWYRTGLPIWRSPVI